jgi:hypothetical protein
MFCDITDKIACRLCFLRILVKKYKIEAAGVTLIPQVFILKNKAIITNNKSNIEHRRSYYIIPPVIILI